MDARSDPETVSAIHEALADPTRQAVLEVLRTTDRTTREALVAEIEGVDRWSAGGPIRYGDAETLETALHHVHLPKLDDADVIDYDPDSGRVDASCAGDTAMTVAERIAHWDADEA